MNKEENYDLGYACINMTLSEQGISTNSRMIKKTFLEQGVALVNEKAKSNLSSLLKILKWNVQNGIRVYRMSSDLIPWMSEYNFDSLDSEVFALCSKVGDYATSNNIRLSFHPGQFDVLCSKNETVVKNTVIDLNQHARILDLMNLEQSRKYPINIHIGAAYDSKIDCLNAFCKNFEQLSDSAKARLVIENDDKESMYSVNDLLFVYEKIGTSITFDFHHHRVANSNIDEQTAYNEAIKTWGNNKPLFHYSSSKQLEIELSLKRAHADYIYEKVPDYVSGVDIEIEAKMKEMALLRYREQFYN